MDIHPVARRWRVDIWGLLALFFVGAFFALLIIALFYWWTVRPRLLEILPPPVSPLPRDAHLEDAIQSLNEALVRHSSLIARLPTSYALRAGEGSPPDQAALAALQDAQAEQTAALSRLAGQIGALTGTQESLARDYEALRERLSDSQVALGELQALLKALNAGNLSTSAALTRQGEALQMLQERQARDSDVLAILQGQAAEGQAALRAGLDELHRRLEALNVETLRAALAGERGPAHDRALEALRGEIASYQADLRTGLDGLQAFIQTLTVDHLNTTLAEQGETLKAIQAQRQRDDEALAALREGVAGQTAALQADLAELQRLLTALGEDAITTSAALAEQGETLQALQARQARSEEALTELREQIARVLASQQAHTRMLDALADQTIPLQRIIREEKIVVQDRLQDIKGIGPVFSGLLLEHGIRTFEQLSRLTPQELRALVDVPRWRAIDAESWIEQAKLFASQRQKMEDAT